MGMEVAGFEIVHGNGEVRVESFSNPHEKENRAKANDDIVLNANFPKDAADERPAEQKMHSFYIVRYRSYDKPNLMAKIDQADKEIWKRNHQRVQILDRIKAKRLDRVQIIEQLRSLGQEHRQYRTVVDEKLNQVKPLKEALGSLRDSNNASSDKVMIQRLNYRMQHEVISLSEEKQRIREIKQLEGTRDKVIANAVMRAKIQVSMGQKEAIQDQLIGTDLDGVRKEREVVKSRIKQLEDELKLIDGDIGTLQLELTSILEKRDKAVETIYELRRQRDGKNACCFQNRTLLNNAKDLAAEKNIEALKELSCEEVEKFMASWNSSKSFRDDYEKRISTSLDIRQLNRDGRMRNPDEKPLFLVQQTNKPAEAQTLAKATPKPEKQDPEPVKEQENIPAEKESKRKQEEPKTAVKLNNVEDDEEYYIVELPKKENEIDEATLKEIKKQEEMEKQKQAMERNKKLAEKAAAKAALRAQKEAEKKQKEREKKMKKKESFSAAEAEKFEKVEEKVKTVVTGKTKESKDVSTTVSVRYRGRTKCCDSSIPKAILKRKRSNKYLLWVAAAAVLDEDNEEYGSPISLPSAIADIIKSRTEALLKKTQRAVSSKPIVMRAEYAHCPNLTIIDTPGFVLKAKKGEPESTPDEILGMVKSLASPPHRILLFLQQSSVEWCSSLWLDAIRDIDPTFRRTIVVVSKFDNRLKEFGDRWEVDRYLSASGYLGDNVRPFFVALPKDRTTIPNDEFRRQVSQVDSEVIRHLRDGVKGGFDEEKFGHFIGFSSLREFLETELQRRYKEAVPATLALLEQRCSDVIHELAKMESKIQATSDVSQLRRAAILNTASISNHVGALIDGAADPSPEHWGKTTEEERLESGIGSWPGVTAVVKPLNSTLRLYGGAAFERAMHEFRCVAYSIECPPVSREKVANILLAHAGRGGGRGSAEAAAEIARTAARSWLAPLLDTACDRLAFVLGNLFDLAIERSHRRMSDYGKKIEDMDGYVGFHASLRYSYNRFIKDLAKECKKLVRHHLDSVTSPYSLACYESDFQVGFGSSITSFDQAFASSFCPDLSDSGLASKDSAIRDQENKHLQKNAQQTTPGKGSEPREALKENQMTVPETPSPDQPSDSGYGVVKKELGNAIEVGARKRNSRMMIHGRNNMDLLKVQNGGLFFGSGDNAGSRTGSAYSDICSSAAHHFARIREALVERSVTSTLNSGFLIPCRERLMVALSLDLFAVNDNKFMEMFVAPGAIDMLQNERQSLQKRQKVLQSCLQEFKTVARTL